MGKQSAPKPPDLRPYANALEESGKYSAEVAREQLAWAREQDAMNRDILNRVLNVQLPAMEEQAANARADRARYQETFQPLEDNLIQDFWTYDTPARQATERGRAIADVGTAFDATRRNALSRLEGFGIDPSQTRNQALDLGVRVQEAAAKAQAGTAATRNVEDKARALRADAVNIGRGMPSQVAQSYGQAVQAGSAGVGGANQTSGTSGTLAGSPGSWMNTAQGGFTGGANVTNQGYQNQMTQYNANQAANAQMWQGIGSVAGMAGMFLADGGQPRRALPITPGHIADGPGDGSGVDDEIPMQIIDPSTGEVEDEARVSQDEYIIPADVVRAKGVEFFDKLVAKYHTPAAEQRMEMRRALPA